MKDLKNIEEGFSDFSVEIDKGPIVVTAIHHGHQIRKSLQDKINLSSDERLKEEDPFTGNMAMEFGNRIVVHQSRFEVDLNRPPKKAVYTKPEDAWGLEVWKEPLSNEEVAHSLKFYNNFYQELEENLSRIIDAHGYVIVYDLHSYNHRRNGPDSAPANQKDNPDIDLLVSGNDMEIWRPVIDRFKKALRDYPYPGGRLDVREEIRFDPKYSHFMQWILERFPGKAMVVSIEFKKFFMNEWTGKACVDKLVHLQEALKQSMPLVLHEAKINENIAEYI